MPTDAKGGNFLGQAGAYALTQTPTAQSLTYAEITAQRASLQAARLAKGSARHTSSHPVQSYGRSTSMERAARAADRGFRESYINSAPGHVMGDRWAHYVATAHVRHPHITGRNKKFVAELSAGRHLGRTSWSKSRRTSGFHKELTPRRHRFKHQGHWRRKGHEIIAK